MQVVMAQQYITKKVKELFGDKADAAVMRELNQINDFETYVPLKASNLSWEEKKKAIESLIFMAETMNRDIKARKVADGISQSTYMMAATRLMGHHLRWSLRAYL